MNTTLVSIRNFCPQSFKMYITIEINGNKVPIIINTDNVQFMWNNQHMGEQTYPPTM